MHIVQPVILSGGSGTRLWPLSRRLYPKQFMDLGGDTLFGQAVSRAGAMPGSLPPLVICNEEQRFLAAAIVQEKSELPAGGSRNNAKILLEPEGRNTAPAITLACLAAMQAAGPGIDPLLLVLSSDHIISPQEAFNKAVEQAATGAASGRIVVFGVTPTGPETGFGYIKQGERLFPGVFSVDCFVEKPQPEVAEAMLSEGGYVWNSGMFMFKASVFLEELSAHAPEVLSACEDAFAGRKTDHDFTRFNAEQFASCPAVSVDYAVMEKTGKACVTPLEACWSDMGSWEAFYGAGNKDENGNALSGDVVQLDSTGCYLHSSHRLIAGVGLRDLSVVETADAVLVMPRDRSQDVKRLLDELKRRRRQETDIHVRVYRPWGWYEALVLGERFQVKRIMVNPGGILSLQMHHHRAEHWVVVRGTAKITLDEKDLVLKEDQSTYIPLGVKHRLENPGCIPLEIIEIQTGSYLGEDDIVRFEDTYGRVE